MNERTWPITLRYHLRGPVALAIPDHEAHWDTYGVILRDGDGEEHHFGFPEHDRGGIVFTFVASYTDDGRDSAWPGGVHDKLMERGYEVIEPTRGPQLPPLVRAAMEDLAEFATRKGFAFDEERAMAVQVFGTLVRAREQFDPDEIYVWGATNGYDPKDADRLREYARRALEGRGTRSVAGRSLKVDSRRADAMAQRWREELAQSAAP